MGNRIREIRKEHNLTMKQLGKMIGVAESTISQYETGKRQPDNETLLKLGEVLKVTVGYLLGVEEKTPTLADERVNDEAIKFALFDGDGEITDEMFEEVKQFARFVKERNKGK